MSHSRIWFASLLLHAGSLFLVLAVLAFLLVAGRETFPTLDGRLRFVIELGLVFIALGIALRTKWTENSRTPP